MDLLILADAADAMETVSEVEDAFDIVPADSMDFKSWTKLISKIEKTYPENIKAISSVYESFLSWFPLCYGYWKKYADHMARLCTVEKAVEVYEEAVQSATYSVGLWVEYCSFGMLTFADPSDVRRIFERGLSYVGKDFLCHKLWDLYIRFELSQQEWSFLAHILIRALKFPTKSLHKYYDNFKEFADFVEEDMSCAKSRNLEPYVSDCNIEVAVLDDEIYHTIRKLQESSSVELRSEALHKFIAIGEQFYHKSCQLHEEIDYFENYMESDLFSVKPLDDEELQNWHNYLDFIEKQEDFDWAVKLYERCLIPCANYPEFWMRYVEFMESKGGREIASFALERATQVFLKNVSEVHIFNARFKEKIGDIEGARAAFHLCDTESDSSFIEMAIKEANMETRLGNADAALEIYKKALKVATEKEKTHIIPTLYIHFFRLKFTITGSADAAIDLLISGIQQVPHSKLLFEELINFAMMHEGSRHLVVLDSIVATAITCKSDGSQGLSSRDREDLSHLYLKFVDYCGTTRDITMAWARHIRHFPRLVRCTSSHKYLSNDLVETRDMMPHTGAKPSSQAHVKHTAQNPANEKHNLLTSESQAIELHKATANQHVEKDDNNSVKSKRSKRKSSSVSRNERHESQESERIRTELEIEEEEEEEEEHGHEVETSQKAISLETLSLCTQVEEPNNLFHKSFTALEDTMNPSTANQNSTTDSPKKPDVTDEHGSETDPPQIPSQNVELCKTNHMLTASEHASPEPTAHIVTIAQLPNNGHPTVPNAPQIAQLTAQYPVQSSEQSGLVQNPQPYNQMMQYQYQQQHQNQQQWLQMQQSYQQSYIQQQQQYAPQTQQYQLYQQQEQYQQYWQQMYQQQQQQQQMQEYMKMQQYQQIQQQQQQQQKQLPQDLHQHQITALANQIWKASQQGRGTMPPNTTILPYTQPNTANVVAQSMAAPTLTNIVQGTMPPDTTILPYAQPNMASVVVQSMAAPTLTNIVSPVNRQQPSDSKNIRSPSFDR